MVFGIYSEIATWTVQNCDVEPSLATTFLSLTRYVGPLLTLALFAYGFRAREVYLLLFSAGLMGDAFTNIVWRHVLRDTDRVVDTCTDAYEPFASPSYQTQHTTFFVVFTATYTVLFNAYTVRLWHFIALAAFFNWVVYADTVLNYHTELSIMTAAYIGAFNAAVWQFAVRYVFYPTFPFVLRHTNFIDTLCNLDCSERRAE